MNETIAAISTANGPGAIGIIRISGDLVLRISSAILFKKNSPPMGQFLGSNPRISVYCELRDGEERLDQIVCVYYKAPHSYTGEDLIELNLHGNPLLLKTVLQLIFRNGARPAKEGEFTKRAFLNNKLNLSEAEAVGRLIAARSRLELELSQKNIFGEISRLASRIRSELISLKAECEAEIDFSTEDLTFESLEDRNKRIKSLGQLCSELIRKSEITEKTISGTKVVIYGAPNTGKSSLLNCIVGKNRAITSHNPGTTRDYISEDIQIEGIPVQLVDTAGVRETSDPVERTGIEQSEREFESARVRLVLFDASSDINLNGFILKNEAKLKNSILVINKIDL
ncbi:MAG: tRNA uridine-5-carboxymethylaminomethyl(34) synthesis GTPase MnmE, partial [Leptospira sp.]|nr:tRNA uridine-5-carboxymethylaminomethyl(34) synthesis GTPase MnmE [Leptospira sp.]